MPVLALALTLFLAPAQSPVRQIYRTETLAVYAGSIHAVCQGITPSCPDHCGVTGDYNVFVVLRYLSHQPQASSTVLVGYPYVTYVAIQEGIDPQATRKIAGLRKGGLVRLSWVMNEVPDNNWVGYRSPHTIVPLELEDAKKALAKAKGGWAPENSQFLAYYRDWESAETLRFPTTFGEKYRDPALKQLGL